MSTLPACESESLPDIRDVIGAMGGEVLDIIDYSKRGKQMSKIEDRIKALEGERTGLIAMRTELESEIAEREQRMALALSRITGINGALEELRNLATEEESDDEPA